jgi:hypothetical protein
MNNERDVHFTPSPSVGAVGEVDFTPDTPLGAAAANRTSTGNLGTGTAGSWNNENEAGGIADKARNAADQLAGRAQQLAGTVQEQATSRVQSRLDEQKNRAADTLASMASSLRSSGQQLRGQQDGISGYIDQAADRLESISRELHDREVGELMEVVEDFARRQPAVFLGGAFALGVLGARFLKSSRRNLVHEGVRDRWSTHQLTSRVEDPERDAIGRPRAPGYAPPEERASNEYKAAGPRRD